MGPQSRVSMPHEGQNGPKKRNQESTFSGSNSGLEACRESPIAPLAALKGFPLCNKLSRNAATIQRRTFAPETHSISFIAPQAHGP